jgi:hypothetical protein
MRKSGLLVSAIVALAIPAQALANGPQSVSQQYTVGSTTVPGVDTGFILKPGLPVTVTATGTVCPFGGTPDTCFGTSPNGYPAFDTTTSSFGGFVLPGAPAWGLVGRVGTGPWTQVGTGPTTLSGTGDLVFAVNDDLFSDNSGNFTATVSYTCYPGNGNGDKNHYHCGPPGQN